MNIALFASNNVGNEIAKFLAKMQERLACLVLDSEDTNGYNNDIILNCGPICSGKIFYSDSLYKKQTLLSLKRMNLDLIILAWWPYIIKKEIIEIPRLGCLNLHPSYLPYNRGKHYNFWTIVEDTPFGVTIHWVDEGIDTGDIAFQTIIEKTWEDTGETLYYKAQEEIINLFKESYPKIKNGDIPRKPQNAAKGTFHTADQIDSASEIKLDKEYKAKDLLNIIRARTFPRYPAAWFLHNGCKYEVRIQITKVGSKG